MKFNFIKNGKIFFAITVAIVLAAIVCFFARGFNMDIEFVGGTELTFTLDKGVKPDEAKITEAVKEIIGSELSSVRTVNGNEVVVRTTLVDSETDFDALNKKIEDAVMGIYADAKLVSKANGSVTFEIPDPNDAVEKNETEDGEETDETEEAEEIEFAPNADIRTALASDASFLTLTVNEDSENKYTVNYTVDTEVNKLRVQVEEAVNALYPFAEGIEDTRLTGTSTVSAEVSDSLKKNAVLATVIAVALMLLYIAIRFEGRAAIAAVICLAHDIIIMLFAYSIFQIPVSSTLIAAILTILGYSINATIVIFDRIRENNKDMPAAMPFEDKADLGVKSTLLRSVNTTVTSLITIGLVYILGVSSIKNFALPLIVGIVAGVYSSVCLSANLWVVLKRAGKKSAK